MNENETNTNTIEEDVKTLLEENKRLEHWSAWRVEESPEEVLAAFGIPVE